MREIDHDIWVTEQPLRYFGLNVGTRMTIIRLSQGELVVISPIQPTTEMVNQLRKLGEVRHIIAPNLYHYLFAEEFKKLYPKAIFWAAPGLELKKPNFPIDQTIVVKASSLWDGLEHIFFDGFRTLDLRGFVPLNECVFFHSVSRTLILTDAAFNFDESFPVLTQFAARLIGGYKKLSPSLLERVATTEKEKVRKSVEKILTWDFQRVIMAHGSIVEKNAKQKFKLGYEDFLGKTIHTENEPFDK
jgi:Domain of unknown function (DUF4336)